MNIIPHISDQLYFTVTVTLDGVTYELEYNWNHRCGFWSITVSDSAGNVLIAGVKIVLEFDLFKRYSKTALPKGLFIAIRDGLDKAKLRFDELGKNANIIYVTEAEYESL